MKFDPVVIIAASATVAMNSLALQKKAAGERVYNLSAGEAILPPDELIIAAADEAVRAGKTLYPPVAGIPELRQSMAKWMNESYQTQYTAEQVLVTCGGKFGIYAFCQAFIQKGDEVILIAPYWTSYPDIVRIYGGSPVIVNTKEEDKWQVDPAELENAFTKKTKMIILNNAANPTGVFYHREALRQILDLAQRHNVLVMSDEVYSGLVYDGREFVSCASFPEYRDRTIVIQSCSKHFAMTGWRVGFVLAPEPVIKILAMLQGQSTSGTSSISQWAALAAVDNAAAIIPKARAAMQKRRDALIAACRTHLGMTVDAPASALYLFIALKQLGSAQTNSVKFCEELLDKANIATVPGSAFGQEGYIRLSFGVPEAELTEAAQALGQFIKK